MNMMPRKQDLMVIAFAALAVAACLFYPVPTWMLVAAAFLLIVVVIGALGNMGMFGRTRRE